MAPVERPPCATTHPTNTFEHSRFQSAVALHRRAPTDQIKQITIAEIHLFVTCRVKHSPPLTPAHAHAHAHAHTQPCNTDLLPSTSFTVYQAPVPVRIYLKGKVLPSFHSLNATHQYIEQVKARSFLPFTPSMQHTNTLNKYNNTAPSLPPFPFPFPFPTILFRYGSWGVHTQNPNPHTHTHTHTHTQ